MKSQIHLLIIIIEKLVAGRYKPLGSIMINDIDVICDDCLRYYDGAPCLPKKDDDPCEDFVPRYFKDGYVYINSKWFKSKPV